MYLDVQNNIFSQEYKKARISVLKCPLYHVRSKVMVKNEKFMVILHHKRHASSQVKMLKKLYKVHMHVSKNFEWMLEFPIINFHFIRSCQSSVKGNFSMKKSNFFFLISIILHR